VANRPQLVIVQRRSCKSRTVLGAATTLALNAYATAVLAVRPVLAGVRATRPWPAVVVTRRHASSTAPTAAQRNWLPRSAPAAALPTVVRSCKAPSYALVGSGRSPFIKRYPHNRVFGEGVPSPGPDVGPRLCRRSLTSHQNL
jgi:hypothetical protein